MHWVGGWGEPGEIIIPRHADDRGSLSVVEFSGCLPFTPRRFYYLYDLSTTTARAGHAHWIEQEVMLAIHGSFTVRIGDGESFREFVLERPDRGVHVPAGWWHELTGFSGEAVCAVFASEPYNPEDYCRDYDEFINLRHRK